MMLARRGDPLAAGRSFAESAKVSDLAAAPVHRDMPGSADVHARSFDDGEVEVEGAVVIRVIGLNDVQVVRALPAGDQLA